VRGREGEGGGKKMGVMEGKRRWEGEGSGGG